MKKKLLLVLTLSLGFLGCLNAAEQIRPEEHAKVAKTVSVQVIKCGFCEKTFSQKPNYYSHVINKHYDQYMEKKRHEVKVTSTYCLKCNVEFETAYYKKRHNQEFHTGPKDFPCVFCVKSFDSQSALTGHANRDHKEKLSTINNFVCHDCGKSYEKKCQLIQHFRDSICTRKISDAIKKDDKDDAQFAIKRNKVKSSTTPVTITHPTTSTRTTLINDDNDHYQGEIDKVEAAIILLNMKSKKN